MTGSSVSLPPVPNAAGEPRPPAAPRVVGPSGGRRRVTSFHYRVEKGWSVRGIDGDDQPLLEAAVVRRTVLGRLRHAGLSALYTWLIPVVAAPIAILVSAGADQASADQLALAFSIYGLVLGTALTLTLLWYLIVDSSHRGLQAGAHVVSDHGDVGDARAVPLYELVSITMIEADLGPTLRLVSREDSALELPCGLLEGNQQLWDLVYNGIRHSTANGAKVDRHTRRLLGLPPADLTGDPDPRHEHRPGPEWDNHVC